MAYLMERAHSWSSRARAKRSSRRRTRSSAAAAKLLHYAADARGDYARALDGHHRATAYAHRLAAEDDQREPAPSVTRASHSCSRLPRAPLALHAWTRRRSRTSTGSPRPPTAGPPSWPAPWRTSAPLRSCSNPYAHPPGAPDAAGRAPGRGRAPPGDPRDALAAEAEPRRSRWRASAQKTAARKPLKQGFHRAMSFFSNKSVALFLRGRRF